MLGQVTAPITVPADSTEYSEEELFLQEIAEKALKQEKTTKKVFISAIVLIVAYTAVDYYLEKKDDVDN